MIYINQYLFDIIFYLFLILLKQEKNNYYFLINITIYIYVSCMIKFKLSDD